MPSITDDLREMLDRMERGGLAAQLGAMAWRPEERGAGEAVVVLDIGAAQRIPVMQVLRGLNQSALPEPQNEGN
jgi:hypothetical protein